MQIRNHSQWFAYFAASALVATGMALAASLSASSASLGTIELKGGTVKKTVSTAAITPGQGKELVGKLVNKTGMDMHDVTVELRKVGETNDAPTGGDTDVKRPGPGSSTSSGAGTENSSQTGTTTNVSFAGGVGKAKADDTLEVEIDVDSTDGDDITVHFTPSTKGLQPDANAHADIISRYSLSTSESAQTNGITIPFHDRAAMRITNKARAEESIASISGSVTFGTGDPTSLLSAHLSYPSGMITPTGTQVTLSGNSFEISDFPPLGPSSSYDLVLVFSGTPGDAYKVWLSSDF